MAGIANDVKQIRQALYGREVREAIAHGIEQCYSDVTASKTVADTAAAAANTATQNAQTATQQANQARDNAQAVADGVVNQSITAINDAAAQQRQSINDLGDQLKSYMSEHYSETITKAEAKANRSSVSTVKHATGTDGQLTLTDALNEPAKKMTIHLEPKQDLHGYNKPWIGGTGKNLCPVNSITGKNAISGIDCNIPAGSYTLSYNKPDNHILSFRFYFVKGDNANSTTIMANPGHNFTLERDVVSLNLIISPADSDTVTLDNIQIEAGSTITSYEPYENICPITGYDTVEAVATGKNMLRGWNQTGNTSKTKLIRADFANDNVYTVDIGSDFRNCKGMIYYFNENEEYVGRSVGSSNWPITVRPTTSISTDASGTLRENNIKYIQIVIYSGIPSPVTISVLDGLNVQVKCNDTSTDYVDPNHNEISINLVSSAGSTVYGGTVTVNEDGSGTLVVDKQHIVMDGVTTGQKFTNKSGTSGTNNYFTSFTDYADMFGPDAGYIPVSKLSAHGFKCSLANTYNTGSVVYGASAYINPSGAFQPRFTFPYTEEYDSVAKVNEVLAAWYNDGKPLEYTIPLAETLSYPLTATQLQTLVGTNHVWTDGTNIELDYYGDKYCTYEQVMELIANALRS